MSFSYFKYCFSFYWNAKTIYKIHSPLIFKLVANSVENRKHYYWFDELKEKKIQNKSYYQSIFYLMLQLNSVDIKIEGALETIELITILKSSKSKLYYPKITKEQLEVLSIYNWENRLLQNDSSVKAIYFGKGIYNAESGYDLPPHFEWALINECDVKRSHRFKNKWKGNINLDFFQYSLVLNSLNEKAINQYICVIAHKFKPFQLGFFG